MPIDPVDWTARRALDRYDVGELHIGRRYAGECNVVYRVADFSGRGVDRGIGVIAVAGFIQVSAGLVTAVGR